ncbi:MAG: tetratricopeptide (TPR) repeat protein, partial [Myxococcota bacterium]
GEGPPDTTGPTPVRLSDTQQELMPSVLFGVGEPIPVAPAAPESSGDMGAGKGYLLAAAVIVAAAVIWGMVREQPPVAQPPGPSAPDVVRRLNPDVLLERAHTDRDKSPELALVSARAAANAWPNSGTAQLLLARALSRSGDYPAAQKVLEKAEKLLPESLEPGRLLVELLLKRGSASAAVAAARRALLTHSTDGTMHLLLARGLLAERHPDEALKSLATATLLDPDNAEAQRLLGRARAARGEHAPARDAFGAAIKLDPQDASAYVGLSRSLLALGRGGEATDLLRRGLVIAPDSEELHYAVGRVLLQDGRYDEAATQLARVVSRFPDGWRAWFALGLAELHRGRNAEAVQALEKAASRRNQAEILHDLGLALSRLGMRGKAVEAFGEAIQLKYDLWQSHCERARVYFRLERYQDATRGWRETQKLNPRCAVAAAMLEAPHGTALAHLQLGLPCAPQDALDLPD